MQLDLNLLSALDCLLEEESVQAAADRLRLSSPAMSRTLGRLRRVTGDQILVRTGRAMVPTPYASAVRGQVHELVQAAHHVLQPTAVLDLERLVRTFTVQCHDALTSALAPGLLAATRSQAAGVTLRFLGEAALDQPDLRHDRVDLVIGSTEPAQPDIVHETLGTGAIVVALRRDHLFARRPLEVAGYASAEHVIVSRRGRLNDPVDTALAAFGRQRRVVASVPTSEAALRLVGSCDAITSVADLACRHLLDAFDLVTVPLPVDVPPVPAVMAWHRRYDTDPAHRWLREQVRNCLTPIPFS